MKPPAQHGSVPQRLKPRVRALFCGTAEAVPYRILATAGFLLFTAGTAAFTQQPIGTVITENASVSGLVTVSNQKATIANQGSITAATNRTAELALTRGGTVKVCSTSSVHVSQANTANPPLLVALDRGALEANFPVTAADTLMTPDLRFQISGAGQLSLRLRVTPNGDTCVDNRSKPDAPPLHVTNPFGPEGYFVKPGQHLLFVGGSMTKVIDTETTNCGCPAPQTAAPVQVADGKPLTPSQAAAEHPFPEAQSAGLELGPGVPQAPAGEVHTQVTTAFSVDGNAPKAEAKPEAASAPPAAAAKPEPEPKRNAFQSIGHFFKKMFGGK